MPQDLQVELELKVRVELRNLKELVPALIEELQALQTERRPDYLIGRIDLFEARPLLEVVETMTRLRAFVAVDRGCIQRAIEEVRRA